MESFLLHYLHNHCKSEDSNTEKMGLPKFVRSPPLRWLSSLFHYIFINPNLPPEKLTCQIQWFSQLHPAAWWVWGQIITVKLLRFSIWRDFQNVLSPSAMTPLPNPPTNQTLQVPLVSCSPCHPPVRAKNDSTHLCSTLYCQRSGQWWRSPLMEKHRMGLKVIQNYKSA